MALWSNTLKPVEHMYKMVIILYFSKFYSLDISLSDIHYILQNTSQAKGYQC